eukprot:gnl/Dysnectes_brevis/4386_a5875_509.p1 GENE.gnl/Dysnectes_brevis/4386_a5875_509~~gnl/Dysnectes_brevis/4386_a5875_509.p1  ORF type:complete len:850 (-),score=118.38 gnl/Dysnectes_brevis/4386_a5875_509:128-2677(-)
MKRCKHLREYNYEDVLNFLSQEQFAKGLVNGNIKCGTPGCAFKMPDVWLCCTCGLTCCGRDNSAHSLTHFKETRHTHFLHLGFEGVWCYECGNWVNGRDVSRSITAAKSISRGENLDAHRPSSRNRRGISRIKRTATPRRAKPHPDAFGRVGLQNLANTCYLNAALQAILHVPQFGRYFWSMFPYLSHAPACSTKRGGVLRSLLLLHFTQLAAALQYNGNRSEQLSPAPFLRPFQLLAPSFAGFRQQDAQEFTARLLSQLHEALLPMAGGGSTDPLRIVGDPRKYSAGPHCIRMNPGPFWGYRKIRGSCQDRVGAPTIVNSVFGGRFLNTVRCLECGHVSKTYERFRDISLPLTGRIYEQAQASTQSQSRTRTDGCTLEACLEAFTAAEQLDGDNKYRCDACGRVTKAEKCTRLFDLPPVLCIHLKRFMFSFFGKKLTAKVAAPEDKLNLSPFVADSSPHCRFDKLASSINHQRLFKTLAAGGTSPMSGDILKAGGTVYRLVSVINHHGQFGSGHYTAFARSPGGWMRFDDDKVRPLPANQPPVGGDAYMLFYERETAPLQRRIRDGVLSMIRQEFDGRPTDMTKLGAGPPPHAHPAPYAPPPVKSEQPEVDGIEFSKKNPRRITSPSPWDAPVLSADWMYRLIALPNPGPINNSMLICPTHRCPCDTALQAGRLALQPTMLAPAYPVSRGLWSLLKALYGCDSPILASELTQCPGALATARRSEEAAAVAAAMVEPSGPWHLVRTSWLSVWRRFVIGFGDLPPPLTNEGILGGRGRLNPRLLEGKDFVRVCHGVWLLLISWYGTPMLEDYPVDSSGGPVSVVGVEERPDTTAQEHSCDSGVLLDSLVK